jgi:uridine phosphorylase
VLVFIAAEPREFDGFSVHVDALERVDLGVHWARRGIWKNQAVTLLANGAGPARSHAAARACHDVTAIINTGFCGSLDSALNVGDIVVADKVFFSSQMFPCQPVSTSEKFQRGLVYSSARIAGTSAEKRRLRGMGALAVEMEAGGIVRYANKYGIPFYCVRAVSDLALETFVNDFNAALGPDGRFRTGRLLGAALLRPHRRLPELMRLKKRCDVAGAKLGDFLDSCSF